MKTAKRLLALLLIALTLLPCFVFPASAKNVCKDISGKSDANGAVNTIFYVTTKNKNTHKIKMTMTKGKFVRDDYVTVFHGKNIYDFYEIIVYGKDANGKYVQISKENVKNKSSHWIKLSNYTEYKVKIYSWKTSTINSYKKYYTQWKSPVDNVIWEKVPTWYISKTKGVTFCT